MSLSDKIKQKTDQVIANFSKPKPQPQPTHGTVTGFEQGLIQVSTSEGQQLRQQQGTRAIGVGDRVVAHDNTAVFTGEAGVLPKPGRVFIAAQVKKKFEDYYLFRYREYSPSDRALSENRRANVLVGDDIPIRSLSDGRILAYHPDRSSVTPVKDRLLLSNGKGLAVEAPGWGADAPTRINSSIQPDPRVIVYQGRVTVLYTYTAPMRQLAKVTSFDSSLKLLSQKAVTLAVGIEGIPGVAPPRTISSIVPEFDHKAYAKGLDWFPPVFMGGGLVLNQIYGSAPNVRVFPIGISRFDHYTLDMPFGPLGRLYSSSQVSGDSVDYERQREIFRDSITGDGFRPPDASTARATRVSNISFNYRGIDVGENDGEVARLAALVDAPDYSSDPELGPYFDNAGIWNTLQKP